MSAQINDLLFTVFSRDLLNIGLIDSLAESFERKGLFNCHHLRRKTLGFLPLFSPLYIPSPNSASLPWESHVMDEGLTPGQCHLPTECVSVCDSKSTSCKAIAAVSLHIQNTRKGRMKCFFSRLLLVFVTPLFLTTIFPSCGSYLSSGLVTAVGTVQRGKEGGRRGGTGSGTGWPGVFWSSKRLECESM